MMQELTEKEKSAAQEVIVLLSVGLIPNEFKLTGVEADSGDA